MSDVSSMDRLPRTDCCCVNNAFNGFKLLSYVMSDFVFGRGQRVTALFMWFFIVERDSVIGSLSYSLHGHSHLLYYNSSHISANCVTLGKAQVADRRDTAVCCTTPR